MRLKAAELKEFLDEKTDRYNRSSFIPTDPIQIPHEFSLKEDIEIMGFLVATIAWGQRQTIINNGKRLIELLGDPHDFVLHASRGEIEKLSGFTHRTFQRDDLPYFIRSLKNLYLNHEGLEGAFSQSEDPAQRIYLFRKVFLETPHEKRSEKHLSNPLSGSSAKRLNMYLRWMVRKDQRGVDFGIWNKIDPGSLMLPLDVHTGNVSRKLKILKRKQNDWKSVVEVSGKLRKLDPKDPIKYDFALFGLGAFEGF